MIDFDYIFSLFFMTGILQFFIIIVFKGLYSIVRGLR